MKIKKYKSMEYYLSLPWTFETIPSDDETESWTTRIKELPGCMSHGKTPEKSLHHIKDAITSSILASMELKKNIPEPLNKTRKPTHPGIILKKEFMEPLGLSPLKLAQEIKIPTKTINKIINKKRSVSPEIALCLSKYFETSIELWLNLQNQ